MSEWQAYIFAYGQCWSCRRNFTFNADLVPSIPIDPESNRPPDMGGDAERAVRQPICADCIALANRNRQAEGRPLIDVHPFAYGPEEL